MGKTCLGYSNWGDAAVITATSEDADFPVENLQTIQVVGGDRFRTAGTSVDIDLDRGSAQLANLVSALYTNLTTAATWRIRFATSQANLTSSPTYDSGSIAAWASPILANLRAAGFFVHAIQPLFGEGVNQRWCRVTIADATNPDGYISIGRLYVCNAWESLRGRRYNDALPGIRSYSERTRLNGATIVSRVRGRATQRMEIVSDNEVEAFTTYYDLSRIRDSRDVLVASDYDDTIVRHSKMIYGLLGDIREPTEPARGVWSIPIEVEEI